MSIPPLMMGSAAIVGWNSGSSSTSITNTFCYYKKPETRGLAGTSSSVCFSCSGLDLVESRAVEERARSGFMS